MGKSSSNKELRWLFNKDRAFKGFTALLALILLLLVIGIFFKLILSSRLSFGAFGFKFLTSSVWDPVKGIFGALPFIWGTFVSATLALCFALPLSIGIAIFLSELSPLWMRQPVSFIIDLLAAIPSVIYGFWGLFVLAPVMQIYIEPVLAKYLGFLPLFKGYPLGVGMLTGSIIVAIMIMPTISSISREVLATVPTHQKEAALAIGMTKWETIWKIMLPYGRSGIVAAVILGYGRALGETMAVTMVIGNTPQISLSLFDPAYTIASVIANEFSEATNELYLSSLVELGLVLFAITLIFNAFAIFLLWKMKKFEGVRT
ncbi:MAG: phosphate ABC transporter permease subunit PstC [Candidatus Schekmanbacteria bacterium RIFCSPHIGHO2_02_FULL_38_11]|nr:MAG: phosphate ABC transporter permease subunit PstC [Candidatus Schekmanbacteria bacterium RIFCSPHIGHO2_02_FULL_38_11]